MTDETTKPVLPDGAAALLVAIAQANGHPYPHDWADHVGEAFSNPVERVAPPAAEEPAPVDEQAPAPQTEA